MNSDGHMAEGKEVLIREGLFHLSEGSGDRDYLIGSQCRICKNIFFPRKMVCPACMLDNSMEELPLSTRGKVDSYAILQVAPTGFIAPYIVAYIDLPEGITLFSLITGCEPREDAFQIGDEVELVIEKIKEDEKGSDVIGYKFRPIKKSRRTT